MAKTTPTPKTRQPQRIGSIVEGRSAIGIWTQDGYDVLLSPDLARQIGMALLEATSYLEDSDSLPRGPHSGYLQ